MSGPEMTFSVHPRPASDEVRPVADAVPAEQAHIVKLAQAQAADTANHKDTFLGDIAFLIRFAFGRY